MIINADNEEEYIRRCQQNIQACETIQGYPISDKDAMWIGVHVARMMEREKHLPQSTGKRRVKGARR